MLGFVANACPHAEEPRMALDGLSRFKARVLLCVPQACLSTKVATSEKLQQPLATFQAMRRTALGPARREGFVGACVVSGCTEPGALTMTRWLGTLMILFLLNHFNGSSSRRGCNGASEKGARLVVPLKVQ